MDSMKRCMTLLLAALICAGMMRPAAAAGDKKMVVIVADKVSLRDLNDPGAFPHFHEAAKKGALGLMATYTPGGLDSGGAYATLGAGQPVAGDPELAGQAFNRDQDLFSGQSVVSAYKTAMEETAASASDADVLHLGIPALLAANDNAVVPGALGEQLSKHGYTTCVYGNADINGEPRREVALLGMDARGRIEHGDVEWAGLKDPERERPFASVVDMKKLQDAFYEKYYRDSKRAKPYECDLIIIDTGDTSRAEALQNRVVPSAADTVTKKMLQRTDEFLGFVLSHVRMDNTQIMFVSPSPPGRSIDIYETMTPLLLVGNGVKHGQLSSPTTARKGLVSNVDIAPHILNYFKVPIPDTMTGAPLQTRKNGDVISALLRLQFLDAMRVRMGRIEVAGLAGAFLIIGLALLTMLRMPRVAREWKITMGVALSLAAALFPAMIAAALLFNNLFRMAPGGFLHYLILAGAATIIFAVIIAVIPKAEWRAFVVAAFYVVLFCADIVLRGFITRDSVLGMSLQFGAGYTGIQNAPAGLLAGSALTASALLLDNLRDRADKLRLPLLGVLAVVAVLIGLPRLGGNAGALAVTALTFAVFGTVILRKRFHWAEAGMALGAAAAFFALLAVVSALAFRGVPAPATRTAAALVQPGGLQEAVKFSLYRLSANFSLVRSSGVWSLLFLVLGASCVLVIHYPNVRARGLFKRFHNMAHALFAALIGAAAALLLLGAGLATAATILFIPGLAAFILIMSPPVKKSPDSRTQTRKPPARTSTTKTDSKPPSKPPRSKPQQQEKKQKTPSKKPQQKRDGTQKTGSRDSGGGRPPKGGAKSQGSKKPRRRGGNKPRSGPGKGTSGKGGSGRSGGDRGDSGGGDK